MFKDQLYRISADQVISVNANSNLLKNFTSGDFKVLNNCGKAAGNTKIRINETLIIPIIKFSH